MKYTYKPTGVCAMQIEFEMDDDIVRNVKITGGCNGNSKGISALAEGRKKEELISLLSGIKCGFKQTSCPDQLAEALRKTKMV
jgi:uncharacterized protein (TIGR03905 family)